MPFIDSHAHIDGHKFENDRDEMIQRARDNGVEIIVEICNGDVERGSLEEGIEIAESHPFIYAAVGLHPHDAKLWDDQMESRLRTLTRSPKVIAWGEIGLDFYYNHSDPDVQRAVFRRQLEIAGELDLPVVIHSREANRETIDILRENRHSRQKAGIFHCFSGDMEIAWLAQKYTDSGQNRDARFRVALASGPVLCLISMNYWADRAAVLESVWDEVLRTLMLGLLVDDPTAGPVVH